jgi:hypothetical protein
MSNNRHARRAAAACNRERYNRLYQNYIKHLPRVPLDELGTEPERVYHVVMFHDDWCRFYINNNVSECNCNPIVRGHIEPCRS